MTTQATLTLDDLKALVAHKAADDPAFRSALLAAPKAAVEQLLGTDLPGRVTIRAVEEAPDTYIVVLPAPAATGELSDADLESVAGGAGKATDAGAQKAASIVFGGAIGGIGYVGAKLAESFKDKNAGKAIDVTKQIMHCGA